MRRGEKHKRVTNKNLRGLTLLELIITVTIASVIAVSLLAAFQVGIISLKKIEKSSNAYQTARVVFDRIDRDLKNSYAYLKEDSRFNGQSHTLGFFSVSDSHSRAGSVAVPGRIFFERDGRRLVRFCATGQGMLSTLQQGTPAIIADNIQELSFRYARATSDLDNGYEWIDTWPSNETEKCQFPFAVKVTLKLCERGEPLKNVIEFTSVCSLPQ